MIIDISLRIVMKICFVLMRLVLLVWGLYNGLYMFRVNNVMVLFRELLNEFKIVLNKIVVNILVSDVGNRLMISWGYILLVFLMLFLYKWKVIISGMIK